ncbi:hypothetical protein C0J52_07460 [Blattella germanica]|nr:hypothetical protein C0J52_07460 [Blattella germanica]
MRLGKIQETVVGWYEEHLPFIHIWIPKWFRRKYHKAYNNLLINKDRLTSPYVLHLTLKDILIRNQASENIESSENQLTINGTMSCQNCTSLFKEVMYNRTCDNAGVTPHWCSCHQYKKLSPVDDNVQEAAKFVTSKINEWLLKAANLTQKHKRCAELSLLRLVNVRGRTNNQAQHVDYVVLIETAPGNALFEATVRLNIYKHIFQVLGIISRINMYWSQSKCVSDSTLKLYCYCVSS